MLHSSQGTRKHVGIQCQRVNLEKTFLVKGLSKKHQTLHRVGLERNIRFINIKTS